MEDKHSKRSPEFNFIQEKLKERPINRKKLLKRTMMTASMAVIFGLIACFTFLVLEPVFSNWLYPKEEADIVTIPSDADEMLPEDMMQENEETIILENTQVVERVELQVSDYQKLYNMLYGVVHEAEKSIVNVTGVSQDVDLFNNPYESKGKATGLVVADNGNELLILVSSNILEEVDDIRVTFVDEEKYIGTLVEQDSNTELAIIAVDKSEMKVSTLKEVELAVLGNSKAKGLLANPVIAIGSPYGIEDSIAYGMVTSTSTQLSMIDYNYTLLTTDIYGSQDAGGILLNMSGQVIGIINQKYNSEGMENLISAIGISELKHTIERMSNDKQQAVLGIYVREMDKNLSEELGVPIGAYVTGVVMNSPAMKEGIQSGDIIVKIDENEIKSYGTFISALDQYKSDQKAVVTVMRQGLSEYQEMEFEVMLGN